MAKKLVGCLPTNVMGKIHLGLMYTKQLVGCLAHEHVKWAKKLVDFAILTKKLSCRLLNAPEKWGGGGTRRLLAA